MAPRPRGILLIPLIFGIAAAAADEAKTGTDQTPGSVSYDVGGRLVTLNEVSAADLPVPPRKPVLDAPPAPGPVSQTWLAQRPMVKYLTFGGTVYRPRSGPARTLVRWHGQDPGEAAVFWSSMDWDLLRDGDFTLPDGRKLRLVLLLSIHDEQQMEAMHRRWGGSYQRPQPPVFPEGDSGYQMVSGKPSAEQARDLEALHGLYDRHYEELVRLADQRLAAQLAAGEAAGLQEVPPPEDVVIRYRVLKPEELKNR